METLVLPKRTLKVTRYRLFLFTKIEITDFTNEAKGFSFISLIWGVGSIGILQ